MLGAQAFTRAIGLITSIVVGRLLGPRALGLAAELVISSLTLVIVDFGFASATVSGPS